MARFDVRYDWSRPVLSGLAMGPSRSWIEIEDGRLRVRMGWAFALDAPLQAVASAELLGESLSAKILRGVGVHGWGKRWRVNGAASPIVRITFTEPQRARSAGVPLRVRELDVSPADPDALLLGLGHPS